MRVTTLIFLFCATPSLFATSRLTRVREPRFQCEHVLLKSKAQGEFSSAQRTLASIFDYSARSKSMDVLPDLRPPALEAFNLKFNTPLENLRLATSWLHGALRPEADLYLHTPGEKPVTLVRFTLDEDRVYRWRSAYAEAEADAELGFVVAGEQHYHLRPYLSVRRLNAGESVFVLGLDVDCTELREYTARPETTFRVLTEFGILCRVPVLMGGGLSSFGNKLQKSTPAEPLRTIGH